MNKRDINTTGKYLSPKSDLTFKRIFGEHKNLLISFLNSLLDFDDKTKIVSIEYQSPEMIPNNQVKKFSIVDVKCKDSNDRQFIVEMQMVWYNDFLQRALHNTTKAYSDQLNDGDIYRKSMPVYTICLLNQDFNPMLLEESNENEFMLINSDNKEEIEDILKERKERIKKRKKEQQNLDDPYAFYHYHKLVDIYHKDQVIEGLNILLIELQKFKPSTITDKKMMVLWLRFLNEINEQTETISPDLLEDEEIKEAIEIVERSTYTKEQILAYDHFWDEVRMALNFDADYVRGEALAEGEAIGFVKGKTEGRVEGEREATLRNAKKMKEEEIDTNLISKITGLSVDEIASL